MEKSLRWFKMRTVKNYVGIILCACVIIFIYKTFDISLFSNILSAFIPLIVGAILAYFLQPLVYKFEMFLDSFQNKKLIKYSHTISSIFVFVVFVLIIVVLMIAIIPALVNYVVNIADNLTLYIKNFEKTLETYLGSNLASKVIIKIDEMVVKYVNSIEAIDPIATLGTIFKAGSTIITAVLGLIFTPYVLIEAKKLVSIFDRLCSLFMSKEKIELIHDYAVRSHQIFGQFIYGKFLDSLIIGIIAFIGLAILKVKFFPILAVFILITNMIPYFGPFIGGFPAVLVALMTGDLFHALAVLVFVFALQQFDGLFLGPKILGDVVGISPFWVLLSITVFGHFFGFIGMFLGVPMICVIRMLFNDIIDFRNKMKELDT